LYQFKIGSLIANSTSMLRERRTIQTPLQSRRWRRRNFINCKTNKHNKTQTV